MQKLSDILLADLRAYGMQTSEDDAALLRFAMQAAADDDELLAYLRCRRQGSSLAVRQRALALHRRRLRGLAQLAQDQVAEAFWVGTGAGGRRDTGLNRVRCYRLRVEDAAPFHGVRNDLFRYVIAGGNPQCGRDDTRQGRVQCAEVLPDDLNDDL